jgi:hypothetical protein
MMFGEWGTTDHGESIRIIHRALVCSARALTPQSIWRDMTKSAGMITSR